MLSAQSSSQPATSLNYHKSAAPTFTQTPLNTHPPVPQNKPPPVSNKPPHFTLPPEWKPPPLPTVAQKVPPPKAPKPVSKPPMEPPPVNHPEIPPPSYKLSPSKSDTTSDLHTDSSSSLDAGIQASRNKSRLPPGLDIAVLTRIHPEVDYNAQDFAHKDSLDRRKKDQEAGHPGVPVFSPDGSDTTREFIPPGGSQSELNQQTSMEEEKDKILAYIKNRKVENKITNDDTDTFMTVPADVEAKHQKKHQEKQLRKSLRNKLKRVMPNGRDRKERDDANWQWGKDSGPAVGSEASRLPSTSREMVNNAMSPFSPPILSSRDTNDNDMTTASLSSGETRGSGVGMEVEQSSLILSPQQQQHKNATTITDTTTTTTTTAVGQTPVVTHQQQRKWPLPSNKTVPPQTAPKPSPPIAPKPSTLPKPVLKQHIVAANKPSPPIAPKPQRDQLLNKSYDTDRESTGGSQKSAEQPHPPIPLQLQALAARLVLTVDMLNCCMC